MKLTFWGVRGSIPTPGPDSVRYGGNTSCLEITTDQGERIILDAGTGIRPLGMRLAALMPTSCSIFISHTHWDHIQGLPFFIPLFVPGNNVNIYGAFDPIGMKGIKEILAGQMDYNYFPVRSAELAANITYHTLREAQAVEVGQALVTPILMNHSVLSFGYKVSCGGKTVFYTGDHEDWQNIYAPGESMHGPYQEMTDAKRKALADFARGADVLVADAQYTEEEYTSKQGWGHSTPQAAVALAQAAGIPRVYITHHEPTRTDEGLDAFLENAKNRCQQPGIRLHLAAEGLCVTV